MDIGQNVRISRRAVLDYSVNPQGMHIGDNTLIAGKVIVMSHDLLRNMKVDTYIGKNCFIGNASVILPGVRIGNNVAVGAGSIVTKDIPDGCMVVGNPARIVREGIIINDHAQLVNYGSKV
jgi:acetyltransferase-like isoleucine patch superfamily enzyme